MADIGSSFEKEVSRNETEDLLMTKHETPNWK